MPGDNTSTHSPQECTYTCPNTGQEVLAYRDERHVVVPADEHRGLVADSLALSNEVERLRDGIRQHYLTVTSDPHYVESVNEGVADEADERLWALLEEPTMTENTSDTAVDQLRDALVAIATDNYDAMVRIGGPVVDGVDRYATSDDFHGRAGDWLTYEDFARDLHPARFQAIRQAAQAALDATR